MCLKEAFCSQSRHGMHSARRTSPSRPTSRADDRLGALLRHRQAIRLANAPHPQDLHELALSSAGGGHCNLDKAAAVSILGVATVGWRETGRLDRIGARAEGGREGCRARVLACRRCRDRGQEGTKRGTKKPETTKE